MCRETSDRKEKDTSFYKEFILLLTNLDNISNYLTPF